MGTSLNDMHRPVPAAEKLRLVAHDTLAAIFKNFKTQGIFPYEAYPGYLEKNSQARNGSWRSTGAGFDSFYFQLNHALQGHDVSVREATLEFFFDYYLKFVDMGVGRGRPINRVNRTLAADRDMRYMEWNAQRGSTQRPAIMMEFRYQTDRIQRYFAQAYQYDVQVAIISGIEGVSGDAS